MSLTKLSVKEIANSIDNDSFDMILEHKCLDPIFIMKAYYKSIGVRKYDFYFDINVCLTSLHPLYYLIGYIIYEIIPVLSTSIEKSNYNFDLILDLLVKIWTQDFGIEDKEMHESIRKEMFDLYTKNNINNMLSGLVFGTTLNCTIRSNIGSSVDWLVPKILTFMVYKMKVLQQDANTYYSVWKCSHREIFNI